MKKNVLITGTTGSIGKAAAIALANENCNLIILGRNKQKLEAVKEEIIKMTGNNQIDIVIADLGEPASIKKAAEQIKKQYDSLNSIVNVAAIYSATRKENSTGLELMFATNHLGPFVLTNELLNMLKAGQPSTVVTVAAPSFTKLNFEDLQGKRKFSAFNAFGGSKMMNLMFTYALSRRLEGLGVTSVVCHPGAVKSELTNEMPWFLRAIFSMLGTSGDKAGSMLSKLAINPAYQMSNGKFFKFDDKEIKSNEYSYQQDLQEKLWKISEELSK
jgi:NAD(P)-dependent dehydrogenase (short-subunit alcohol dehydrogenase family)